MPARSVASVLFLTELEAFTGKSIRNDAILYKGTQGIVDPSTKLVTKLLAGREATWTEIQK